MEETSATEINNQIQESLTSIPEYCFERKEDSKEIRLFPGTELFLIMQKVNKQVTYPKDSIRIKFKDRFYKFVYDWQDELVHGIRCFEEQEHN